LRRSKIIQIQKIKMHCVINLSFFENILNAKKYKNWNFEFAEF